MAQQRTRHRRLLAVSMAAAAALAAARSASALTFNLVPAAGMNQQAIDGFTAAGERWSSLFSDPVTVNINIDYRSLSPGVLGQASSVDSTFSYASARTSLTDDRLSPDDFTSVSNLQTTSGVNMLLNRTANSPHGAGSATPYIDNDNDANNTNIRINYANAKALGLRTATNTSTDASITFSNNFTWDFDPKNGISSGAYDFVGVASHEIGHALGFVSGVDILDTNSSGTFYNDNVFTYVTPADLFRFSAQSVADGGAKTIDFTADTRSKFFSIDGGATALAEWATGTVWGDGRQASHWKDNLNIWHMDPTAAPGELMLTSARDRQLFDVIGWNLSNSWSWIDPAGGNFSSGIRWSSTAVPTSGQSASFNLNSTYSINFTTAAASTNATVRGGTVTFQLSNPYTVGGAVEVAPQSSNVATLNVQGGTLSASSAAVGGDGAASGGTGTLSLNTGGTLNIANNLRVWNNGTLKLSGGTLSAGAVMLNGGKIQSTTSVALSAPITSAGGTIQTDTATLTVNGQLTTNSATTLTKTGAGTLNIAGAQNHATGAVFTASGGTTLFGTNAGSTSAPGRLTVNANANVTFNATQNLAALNVGPGATATLASSGSRSIKTSALAMDASGKLDVKNNRLIVDYSGATVEPTIRSLLASAVNDGAWDGFGIQTTATNGDSRYGLGSAEATEVIDFEGNATVMWGGQTVDQTAVLIRFTFLGDANLDGGIDADDYSIIDYNYRRPGTEKRYSQGDFNYDGGIDADDYSIIDYGYGSKKDPLPGAGSAAFDEMFAASDEPAGMTASGMTAVPEPSGLVLAAAAGAVLLRRRRR